MHHRNRRRYTSSDDSEDSDDECLPNRQERNGRQRFARNKDLSSDESHNRRRYRDGHGQWKTVHCLSSDSDSDSSSLDSVCSQRILHNQRRTTRHIKNGSENNSGNCGEKIQNRKKYSNDEVNDRGRISRDRKQYTKNDFCDGRSKTRRKYSEADCGNLRKNSYGRKRYSDDDSCNRVRTTRNRRYSSDDDSSDLGRQKNTQGRKKISDDKLPDHRRTSRNRKKCDQSRHRGKEPDQRRLRSSKSSYSKNQSDSEDSCSSASSDCQYNKHKDKAKLKKDSHRGSQGKAQKRYATKWSTGLDGNVKFPEICYHSVEKRCNYETKGCHKLHANQHYHWQVSRDGKDWINLCPQHSNCLEQLYCQPENEYGTLPALDSRSHNKLKGLLDTKPLGVDFLNMILTSPTKQPLDLRRLYTVQSNGQLISSNTFVWYFKDAKNKWISYGSTDSTGSTSLASPIDSQHIEKIFRQGNAIMTFKNERYSYSIDFKQMMQTNQDTKTNRDVCRRPMFILNINLGPPVPKQSYYTSSNLVNGNLGPPTPKQSYYTSSNLVNVSKTKWSHELYGTVEVPEICYYSVESVCKNETSGCKRLHSTKHFHWQVSVDGNIWYNLLKSQSKSIEKKFCDANSLNVQLNSLNPSELASSNQELLNVLGNGTLSIDLKAMTVTISASKKLSLRRLCSELVPGNSVKENTFIWYFKDKNNKWIAYGDVDSTGTTSLVSNSTSKDLENEFRNKSKTMAIKNGRFTYIIDFGSMKQINQETITSREIQRRPKQHNSNEKLSILKHWAPMPNNNKKGFLRVDLPSSSTEYQKVIGFINGGISNVKKIERIQNKFLWRALENKINEMTEVYGGNAATVNVKQLFHGTSPVVINNICSENFDPRLHGTVAGQREGQGAYFSPYATFSNGYSKADASGNKYMFLARVAIGTIVKGSPSMARPPINQTTGRPYDSTVDNVTTPKIIVKYDKQEFYPEYLITYS
ncbi:unnamed protein product [Meganyctiphanes norvegica]|uniref:Poly [ADP-ribose] polymerase n=1 Tax=Meganyctiphanes norvegica TaxID=48144 RepID=A0AAV2QIB0_MEGNR